jgi:malate dehydrogenase (oxaloacetate-decarboxylating)(NADP+)
MSTTYVSHQARELAPGSGDFDTTHTKVTRQYLKTYGLMPPAVETYEIQAKRCLKQLESKSTPIDKYLYLSHLRNTNAHLFYRLAIDNMKQITPLVYTPVVGEACQKWSDIYSQPEGMYISYLDKGNIKSVLQNWPQKDVEITVLTDGSRILGLGDLGINGMGIPVGKLALYSACGGIRPDATLPICLDLGTSNKALREDPLYLGSRRDKVTAQEEEEFLNELMDALVERWPGIVIQFEDFKNPFPSLERYQSKYTMFNDDIQGTGAVILAGIINAVKATGVPVKDQRAVLLGAGSAAVGVAKQIVQFFMNEGLTEGEARRCFTLVDTKGMVTNDRGDKLAEHKVYFSRDDNEGKQYKSLEEVCEYVKPTILMGLSTIGGAFTPSILTKMGQWNTKPIVFPLSNPSSKSECNFADAMQYTEGRALFASGSPFPSLYHSGKYHTPGQGNNMYVFPGIGLGAILSKSTTVTQGMIYASGDALSTALNETEVGDGWLYPEIGRIRDVSVVVTMGVIRAAQRDNVDRDVRLRSMDDKQLEEFVRARMYDPHKETERLESEVHSFVHMAEAEEEEQPKLAAEGSKL